MIFLMVVCEVVLLMGVVFRKMVIGLVLIVMIVIELFLMLCELLVIVILVFIWVVLILLMVIDDVLVGFRVGDEFVQLGLLVMYCINFDVCVVMFMVVMKLVIVILVCIIYWLVLVILWLMFIVLMRFGFWLLENVDYLGVVLVGNDSLFVLIELLMGCILLDIFGV